MKGLGDVNLPGPFFCNEVRQGTYFNNCHTIIIKKRREYDEHLDK